jgi:hypothetical protein
LPLLVGPETVTGMCQVEVMMPCGHFSYFHPLLLQKWKQDHISFFFDNNGVNQKNGK